MVREMPGVFISGSPFFFREIDRVSLENITIYRCSVLRSKLWIHAQTVSLAASIYSRLRTGCLAVVVSVALLSSMLLVLSPALPNPYDSEAQNFSACCCRSMANRSLAHSNAKTESATGSWLAVILFFVCWPTHTPSKWGLHSILLTLRLTPALQGTSWPIRASTSFISTGTFGDSRSLSWGYSDRCVSQW